MRSGRALVFSVVRKSVVGVELDGGTTTARESRTGADASAHPRLSTAISGVTHAAIDGNDIVRFASV
jgi:hypothetical protein